MYDLNEDPNKAEFLIHTDDILIKLLHYIQFWRENNINAKNLISILSFLSNFLKSPHNDKLLEIQVKKPIKSHKNLIFS